MVIEFLNADSSYAHTLTSILDESDHTMMQLINTASEIWSIFTKNPPKALFYQSLKPLACPRVFQY